MARTESVALGGYYPTPTELIPRIASILEKHTGQGFVTFLDPCAGEGEAVLGLIKRLAVPTKARLFACEMEASRVKVLIQACQHLTQKVVHGDAFRVTFKQGTRDGVSVLFLNPPYDTDRVHGRLEHKFLTRFTPALMDGGTLIFVVPFYALKVSAQYLATEYANVECFRFPEGHYDAFKQVVLVAQKCPSRHGAKPEIVEQVEAYACDGARLPELPNIGSGPLADIPASENYQDGLEEWLLRPVDLSALTAKAQPWKQNARGGNYTRVSGILPDLPIQDLLLRQYPVATPPRPAHIAAGIAAGIFNGSRVEPNDPSLKLPPLLVKGVFDQEYRTIEERENKDGKVTLVQVQQPKLVATVLDLRSHKYRTLGNEGSCKPNISEMTVSGLLTYYGESLMRVMEQQCPILYDPRKDGDRITLAKTVRTPFTAQAHAAKALVMLLGGPDIPLHKRKGKGAFLLGEIGCGKSTVALVVSKTIGSRRPLIICPPHLLKSWENEIAAVLPEAAVRVLDSLSDVDAVGKDPRQQTIVSIVSRETAKLSHSWADVTVCPKCGSPAPEGVDLAKTRARCAVRKLVGKGALASLALKLSHQLTRFSPKDETVGWLLQGRWDRKRIAFYLKKNETQKPEFPGFVASYFDEALEDLLPRFSEDGVKKAIVWALLCTGDEDRIATTAEFFLTQEGYYETNFGLGLLLMLPPNGPRQLAVVERLRQSTARPYHRPWEGLPTLVEDAQKGKSNFQVGGLTLSWADNVLTIGSEATPRSLAAAKLALNALVRVAGFNHAKPCGEFLFQAIPEPRRVALAQYILHRHRRTFDFLIPDEAHEYGSDGSAQERAAHRLTGIGWPFIKMTGSAMNGYAESLFTNIWAISPVFRAEFGREDKQRYIDRYGYRKRVLSEKEDNGKAVSRGAQSDRVEMNARIIGTAPGILPLFLLKHLLPVSVTLHKADLALDLPQCIQSKHLVEPNPEQAARFKNLRDALVAQIKVDQFVEGLAGKLFGQLAELPSYLDRATADTGNKENGDYEIRYPESVGSGFVAAQSPFVATEVLPKEQWMLDTVQRELAEGRNVMVFSWHVALLPRLARLISETIGEKVPILFANKVPTAKRQDWITNTIVKRGARVMLTNPVAIQTGLNNLVHFSTEIWMENPACNPTVFRQAGGRIDRIGATRETRIMFPIYAGTLQEQLYDLLLQKVAVSISTDGLDPESALLAAGVGAEDFLTGLSIGKQLWAMLSAGVLPTVEPVYRPPLKSSGVVSVFEMIESVRE